MEEQIVKKIADIRERIDRPFRVSISSYVTNNEKKKLFELPVSTILIIEEFNIIIPEYPNFEGLVSTRNLTYCEIYDEDDRIFPKYDLLKETSVETPPLEISIANTSTIEYLIAQDLIVHKNICIRFPFVKNYGVPPNGIIIAPIFFRLIAVGRLYSIGESESVRQVIDTTRYMFKEL